jgi:protein translocase SecG subunit
MSNVSTVIPYAQIILSALLTLGVLLQYSAAGVGGAFGGGDSFGSVGHTRRGFEKFLFYGTLVVAVLFVITSLLAIIL